MSVKEGFAELSSDIGECEDSSALLRVFSKLSLSRQRAVLKQEIKRKQYKCLSSLCQLRKALKPLLPFQPDIVRYWMQFMNPRDMLCIARVNKVFKNAGTYAHCNCRYCRYCSKNRYRIALQTCTVLYILFFAVAVTHSIREHYTFRRLLRAPSVLVFAVLQRRRQTQSDHS